MSILFETSLGDLVVDLDAATAPRTTLNFLKLCKLKYYNDCHIFHVDRALSARGGDPTNTGRGGASVFATCYGSQATTFPREPARRSHAFGTLSMTGTPGVAGEPSRLGSQFFFTVAENGDRKHLDEQHAVFGSVVEGQDVLRKIAMAHVDENFRPFRLIRVRHTIVLDDPFPDPGGYPEEVPSSPPPAQGGEGDRLGSDDDEIGEREDGEVWARREARSRAEVLEMLGDVDDADATPPENVLFVCKLNPVTESDDLEIIFSRFGECKADILRDPQTRESLCYGFVEFESKEHAERAFFKMDSTLIDDRRIKVDFSQSVRRLWNARRRRKNS